VRVAVRGIEGGSKRPIPGLDRPALQQVVSKEYDDLERRFTHDLVDGVRALAREIGYRAPLFSQMLTSLGGVQTAKRLLAAPGV
jgi:hypothetical protein